MIIPDRFLHVFHWPAHYQIRLALPAMLLLSLVLHAAGIYLVRSDQPVRGVSLSPLPAKVTVIPPGTASALLAARDPSWLEPGRFRDRLLAEPRAARPLRALEPGLPDLVQPPVPALPEQWVPALPPLAVRPWLSRSWGKTPPPSLQPVTARFTEGGPAITDDLLGRLRAAAPAEPPAAPTELLVVLDAAGEARHVWLLRGCGVPAVDLAAQLAVRRSRFGPPAQGQRGILRVIWGSREAAP